MKASIRKSRERKLKYKRNEGKIYPIREKKHAHLSKHCCDRMKQRGVIPENIQEVYKTGKKFDIGDKVAYTNSKVTIITDNEEGPLNVITVIRDERKENIKVRRNVRSKMQKNDLSMQMLRLCVENGEKKISRPKEKHQTVTWVSKYKDFRARYVMEKNVYIIIDFYKIKT